MRPQRRRQLEQWLGPYLSDRGGSQTDRRGFNLRSRVEKNGTVLTLIPGKEIGPKSDDDIRSVEGKHLFSSFVSGATTLEIMSLTCTFWTTTQQCQIQLSLSNSAVSI